MSYCGTVFVFILCTLFHLSSCGDVPSWLLTLLVLIVCVLEFVCMHQFDTMKERVDKLEEKEMLRERKRKDGADSEK